MSEASSMTTSAHRALQHRHAGGRAVRTVVAAAVVGAFLAGCSLIPKYERPAAPVPQAFPTEGAKGVAVTDTAGQPTAGDIEWQRFFTDERLRRAIAIALENNRDMRIAVLNIEQARAQYQIRRADLFPTVLLAATGNRQPDSKGGISSLYTAGVALASYEIDLFGRVNSLRESALASYFATAEARKAVQIGLIAAVASTYMSVIADDELLTLTRDTLNTREESYRLTKLKFDNGAASELDFQQAVSLVEGARATLAQQERLRLLDRNALQLLLGQHELPQEQEGGEKLADSSMLADIPVGLPSDLLTHRPDILAAEQQLIAANANIGAARAAFFPHISLTASFGTASTQLNGLFKSGSYGWTFAPQVSLPIFDGGRNRANLDSANVSRDIAVAQYEKVIQTAFREVADALAGQTTLSEERRALEATAVSEANRFRLLDLRYQNGASSFLDLLDVQRSMFLAQQAAIEVHLAQLQNQVALYRVLGGGWSQADEAVAAK